MVRLEISVRESWGNASDRYAECPSATTEIGRDLVEKGSAADIDRVAFDRVLRDTEGNGAGACFQNKAPAGKFLFV